MHMMIDLETFGLGSSPAIVQIGAVMFNPWTDDQPLLNGTNKWGGIAWGYGGVASLQSSLLIGATIDQSTIDWWRRQEKEAQASITGRAAYSIEQIVREFDDFYRSQKIEAIWSHGAASDVPWLEATYRLLDRKVPWRHTEVRDTRTLFWMAEQSGWHRGEMLGIKHDALDDAKAQARDVRSAMQWLIDKGVMNNETLPEG